MKINLNQLIFTGTHGLTKEEKLKPQRFQIDLTIDLWTNTIAQDQIDQTVDYRAIKKTVQHIIEAENYDLLESLAQAIAKRLPYHQLIKQIKVTVTKLDIWDNGRPQITLTYQPPYKNNLLDFDLGYVIKELLHTGAVSVPLLPEELRQQLIAEAKTYSFKKQPLIVGKSQVREDLSSFSEFVPPSLYLKLKSNLANLLNYKLALAETNPFTGPIILNDLSLQKYEAGSSGISPHVDYSSCINLIALVLITGKGSFALCDDRAGTNPIYLDTTPGNLILMRAPGFFGSTVRPFHFVNNITEERLSYGLRQDIKK